MLEVPSGGSPLLVLQAASWVPSSPVSGSSHGSGRTPLSSAWQPCFWSLVWSCWSEGGGCVTQLLAALVLLAPIGAVRAGWTRSQCLRETPYHLTTKELQRKGPGVAKGR